MLVMTALFVALTAVGAFIKIPTAWVPFTLQILFVFLAGILLGPFWGAMSQLTYVLLGLIGVPIFEGGGGFGYLFRPSFGYLLGYVAAAAVVGWLTSSPKHRSTLWIVLSCAAGLAAIYAVGLPYMALIVNGYLKQDLNTGTIFMSGMLLFLPWDALKIAAAAALAGMLLPVVDR